MNTNENKARQWHAYNSDNGNIFKLWRISDGTPKAVCIICEAGSPEIEHERAELIAKAVNSYDALVAHCNELNEFANHFEAIITDANFKRVCELLPELEAIANHLSDLRNKA